MKIAFIPIFEIRPFFADQSKRAFWARPENPDSRQIDSSPTKLVQTSVSVNQSYFTFEIKNKKSFIENSIPRKNLNPGFLNLMEFCPRNFQQKSQIPGIQKKIVSQSHLRFYLRSFILSWLVQSSFIFYPINQGENVNYRKFHLFIY